jgi:hypothetical protein
VLSRLPRHPQPVPPIYQPEVAARRVVIAADHPGRKQYRVDSSTAATVLANKFAAGLLDRYLARTGYSSQQTSEHVPAGRPYNLWEPLDGDRDHGAHGIFDNKAHRHSPELWISHHPQIAAAAATAAAAAGLLAAKSLARR